LLVVFSILHPGTSVVQTGLGGVLIALGLFWMGTKRRRRSDKPTQHR
jgi:LPXTG-motif cell wall-anchored protein